jgi:hypothetical protein
MENNYYSKNNKMDRHFLQFQIPTILEQVQLNADAYLIGLEILKSGGLYRSLSVRGSVLLLAFAGLLLL